MATHDNSSSNALAELLDEQAHLSLNELARACCMQPDWVAERLAAGLLHGEHTGGGWG